MAANDTEGLPLPKRADEDNPYGTSANALRIATAAIDHGWHIESWEFCSDHVILRTAKLRAVREYLEQRFTVEDRPARDGRLVVSD